MKFLVINGPNLNLLGQREPAIYGRQDYAALCALVESAAEQRGCTAFCYQSNHEGAIIDTIQQAQGAYDGIVINPGAYTHYSYAIHDALKAIDVPAVEVHISDISSREAFRRISVTAPACVGQISGKGFDGYVLALDLLLGGRHE
ncbi:3-dehydroquinate dehydratase [bioreactor metagenome]|uniref:3-dehydroquinate dehydratase n=1 Tax=bioreactor metagenome TaxID=1076179 RepID=A0A645CW45_9ZZZZ